MIYRELGSTGQKVSAIGIGGWHLGLKHVDEALAIRMVRTAIDEGINFLGPRDGKDPLHRFHRTQRSTHPSIYARSRRTERLRLRYGPDAAQSFRCALPQLCQIGIAGTGETPHRRPRHEEHGEWDPVQIEYGDADQLSSLCIESADFCRDYRNRQHGN